MKSLSECRDIVPVAAHWSYSQWYLSRDIDFSIVLKAYKARAREKYSIPCCNIAFYKDFPVGMVSLKENDLWSRKDLNPWLASLYVHPFFRKRGVGEKLVISVIENSKILDIKRLYLFLDHRENDILEEYYKKLGWLMYDKALDNDGNNTSIYYYDL